MANRIFDQRLQHEPRHETVDRIVGDAVVDGQPVGEANSLNVEIRLDSDDLLAERDLVGLAAECRAKDRGELPKNARRRGGRIECQLGDGAERVEEKVRLKLRLEVVQAGAR
jgi:hypothetical protein